MRTIDISIGHDDDFVITELFDFEFGADACSDGVIDEMALVGVETIVSQPFKKQLERGMLNEEC